MANSIESSYVKFLNKLKLLKSNVADSKIQEEIDKLRIDFDLSVCEPLHKYYAGDDGPGNTDNFYKIIVARCFVYRFNEIVRAAKPFLGDMRLSTLQMMDIIARHSREIEICDCGGHLTTYTELSESRCDNCGLIRKMAGVVALDDSPTVDNQMSKHGSYDTNRHFKYWMDRIRGLKAKKFSDDDMLHIQFVIKRDEIIPAQLVCEKMREILSDPVVNMSFANDYAVYLLQLCGGKPPPTLSRDDIQLAAIKFSKLMRLYDLVISTNGNKPYYPYFFYKIFEVQFEKDPEKLRILQYIHMQSRETIIKNDKIYEKMCALGAADGFIYRPTDAGKYR